MFAAWSCSVQTGRFFHRQSLTASCVLGGRDSQVTLSEDSGAHSLSSPYGKLVLCRAELSEGGSSCLWRTNVFVGVIERRLSGCVAVEDANDPSMASHIMRLQKTLLP